MVAVYKTLLQNDRLHLLHDSVLIINYSRLLTTLMFLDKMIAWGVVKCCAHGLISPQLGRVDGDDFLST